MLGAVCYHHLAVGPLLEGPTTSTVAQGGIKPSINKPLGNIHDPNYSINVPDTQLGVPEWGVSGTKPAMTLILTCNTVLSCFVCF